jgi:hypothetical protein
MGKTLKACRCPRVQARPLALTFADFFVLGASIAFNRFSARLMVLLESRFEMLVFVTRCNIGAMSRCVSIPIRTSLAETYSPIGESG